MRTFTSLEICLFLIRGYNCSTSTENFFTFISISINISPPEPLAFKISKTINLFQLQLVIHLDFKFFLYPSYLHIHFFSLIYFHSCVFQKIIPSYRFLSISLSLSTNTTSSCKPGSSHDFLLDAPLLCTYPYKLCKALVREHLTASIQSAPETSSLPPRVF